MSWVPHSGEGRGKIPLGANDADVRMPACSDIADDTKNEKHSLTEKKPRAGQLILQDGTSLWQCKKAKNLAVRRKTYF